MSEVVLPYSAAFVSIAHNEFALPGVSAYAVCAFADLGLIQFHPDVFA